MSETQVQIYINCDVLICTSSLPSSLPLSHTPFKFSHLDSSMKAYLVPILYLYYCYNKAAFHCHYKGERRETAVAAGESMPGDC